MTPIDTVSSQKNLPDIIEGLVTTIIPVYNRANMLVQAVQSVVNQDYRPIEVIIIDDGSTDDTLEMAKHLEAEKPDEIIVVQQRNAGPGLARQKGLELARGEFIQYLDSDDLLLKEKFTRQVDMLRRRPDCQACYSISHDHFMQNSEYPNKTPTKGTGEYQEKLFPRLLVERWWSTNTPLYRHDVLRSIGPWKPLINEEDWEYDARLAALNATLAWVPESLSIKRWSSREEHLSNDGNYDPIKLRHRALARQSIYSSAIQAGISHDSPEMQHFAHSVFLIARECCRANLREESAWLLNLASKAGYQDHKLLRDIRIFRTLVAILGCKRAARLSENLHRIRSRK
ncbi:MAG: glycosyltransferase [Synechococcaceae cyanobacterium]